MAIATYWMTVATWVQVGIAVIGTVVAVVGTILLLRSLRYSREATTAATKTANTALEANRLAQDIFVADKRAWIGIQQEDVRIVAPMEWKNGIFRVHVQITARNTGHNPAHSVWFEAALVLGEENQAMVLDKVVKSARSTGMSVSNFTVFRNGVQRLGYNTPLYRTDIVEYARHVSSKIKQHVSLDTMPLLIKIIGCIDYGIMSKEDRRRTTFVAHLFRFKDGDSLPLNCAAGIIPTDELRLIVREINAD